MKNKFYFFEAGLREDRAWGKIRKNVESVSAQKGAFLTIDRNNDAILRGFYREEEIRTILIYDQNGESSTLDIKSYSTCEFIFRRREQTLIFKNPARSSVRSFISCLQDASEFQLYAESPEWNLSGAFRFLQSDDTGRIITKIEVMELPLGKNLKAQAVITGKLNLENFDKFSKAKLTKIHGVFGNTALQRFAIQTNGVIRISVEMSFDEVLKFAKGWTTAT